MRAQFGPEESQGDQRRLACAPRDNKRHVFFYLIVAIKVRHELRVGLIETECAAAVYETARRVLERGRI